MTQNLVNVTLFSDIMKVEFPDFDPVKYNKLGFYANSLMAAASKERLLMDSLMSIDNAVFAMVERGWIKASVDSKELIIGQGHILLLRKSSVLYVLDSSEDFTVKIIIARKEILAMVTSGLEMNVFNSLASASGIVLTDQRKLCSINSIFNILANLYSSDGVGHNREVAVMMIRSMLMLCSDGLVQQGIHNDVTDHGDSYSSSDVTLRKLVLLLDEHVKTEHEVVFYANQLNITPKYLNELVRKKTKYKAKELISAFLVGRIKSDLLVSGESVKTIGYEYGFSDQSSFGKFFKKETGMSPLMFRQSRGIKDDE